MGTAVGMTDLEKVVLLQDGRVFATTLDIARVFGKRHDHVIAAARKILENAQSPENSGDSQNQQVMLWFRSFEYLDDRGRKQPAYEVTRQGFALLAMGFTGATAQEFKIKLICRFEELEASLQRRELTLDSLSQDVRHALGGIIKGVAAKQGREHEAHLQAELDAIKRRLAAIERPPEAPDRFLPVVRVLRKRGFPEGKLRGASVSVSSKLRVYCRDTKHPEWVSLSPETNNYIFHVDAWKAWLASVGDAVLILLRSKIAGR